MGNFALPKHGQMRRDLTIIFILRQLRRIPKISTSPWKFSQSWQITLTFSSRSVALSYHLRSASGSNGLEAKEMSPLLGNGPILVLAQNGTRRTPVLVKPYNRVAPDFFPFPD